MSSSILDTYPLSPMQQGMLFHSLYAPDSGVYIKQIVCTLNEEVDVTLLRETWQKTAARHGILRTALHGQDLERPVQEEYASVDVPWLELNWQECSDTNQQDRLAEFLDRDRRRGFVLSRAPLMRLTLIRKGAAEFLVIWTFHHALLDGWSAGLIAREVFKFYDAGRTGQKPTLPLLQPFRSYIDWFENQDLECAKNYWRELLAGFDGPTDMARKSTGLASSSEGNYQYAQTSLSRAATAQLRSFAAQHGVTPGTIVQAAWAMLVGRYTGRDDVVFGVTRAGRHWTVDGAQHMIGLFISTLPVRVRLPADRAVAVWLKDLHNQAVAARPFEHTPLAKVQEWNQISAKQSLFDHIFVFNNQLFNSAVARGSQNSEHRHFISLGTTHYPLAVNGFLEAELVLHIDYNCSSFDAATIARMLGHFRALIENLIQDPHQRLTEVPMLTEREKHQLLVEWINPQTEYPRDKCIHQLFEEQVERTPDAIALVFNKQQLTYRELNSRANQLAHYLRKRGVGSEVFVGLCLERSIDMIAGLLGVVKAGGAYVPLDPAYPAERLRFMLQDAQVAVVLTHMELVENRGWRIEDGDPQSSIRNPRPEVICLDRDWPEIEKESVENLDEEVSPSNLAYAIYTSGSTGKPKGTLVTHHNVVRLFQATEAWFGFNSTDTWTLFHSYAFDFSVWEIWGALLHGGKLVIVPRETTRSAQEFAALLIEHKVTVLNQTPSAFRQLLPVLTAQDRGAPSALRYVIFGGETLELQSLIPWFGRYGEGATQLINMYGVTETTVHVTYRPITRADATSGAGSLIGKPLPDLRVYILDQHRSLVPVGVRGEIYVGGPGVAHGYLNRPELTAERFVDHSFAGERAQRLYRTGDFARYLADGNIEFVGRADNQVKIRGYRIEPGEIETVLAQHPAVMESVVLAQEDKPGDPSTALGTGKQLVAYVVPKESAPPVSDLRAFLKAKLPDYMVPNAFVILESFPLTPNGKVDRKALPPPDCDFAGREQVYVAPRNAVEEIIAGIWADILGKKRIGVHDDFFDLGGHSLKATQIAARLHKVFQSEVPLRHLFDFPTIAELAAVIDSKTIEGLNSDALNRMLSELEAMSEEDAQKQLAPETTAGGKAHEHE